MDDDLRHMRRALRLAARATGRTSPNPLVGAVVVQDGAVVGEGYHHRAGEPHAEVNALTAAGARGRHGLPRWAAHFHGRTAPAPTLVAAGRARGRRHARSGAA